MISRIKAFRNFLSIIGPVIIAVPIKRIRAIDINLVTIRASRGVDIYAACGLLSTKALVNK